MKRILPWLAITLLACSGTTETESSAGVSTSAATSSGAGAGGGCATALTPSSCPVATPVAEAAFDEVMMSCSITMSDIDITDPASPTLTAEGRTKACASCECRQAIFDYHSVYVDCVETSQNAVLAANMHAIADGC